MIVTTTHEVAGARIVEYVGIASGHAIMGANMLKDAFARFRDAVGGRAAAYERVMRSAEEAALEELKAEAIKKGANAVIGVRIDYEPIHASGNLLMAAAYGTAVKIERDEPVRGASK